MFKRLKVYAELVMFSHSLFSLPFALMAMFWAAGGIPKPSIFIWSIVALLGARNGANALNRLIDRKIDARNPRTAQRHMPLGIVRPKEVMLLVTICFALLVLASAMLNPLCLYLSPVAIGLFFLYSYTKRFTWTCHLFLGITCGGAPVGAWIAVTGTIQWPALVLGALVTCWVSGFDIIYAAQDLNFDRKEGLFSIPARFGIRLSLLFSALLHCAVVVILIYLYFLMGAGLLYLIGIGIISVLLVVEHVVVKPDRLESVKFASYSINQIISIVFLVFSASDFFLAKAGLWAGI